MPSQDEYLRILSTIAAAQQEQIELSKEAIRLMSDFEEARRYDSRKAWHEWKAELQELGSRSARSHRRLARIYGVMMLFLGGLLAVSWMHTLRP